MDAKIRALGGLVAGIAHEINTPLGVVTSATATSERSAAQLARAVEEAHDLAELRWDAKVERAMSAIREVSEITPKAANRINELVASLKDFARLDRSEVAEVDLHACLERTLQLIDPQLKAKVEIVRDYGDIPHVSSRPHEVSQVLMTLLVNAFEAMKGEGVLTLTTSADADAVRLDIADTGCGMNEKQIEHLFDVRFSDKSGRVGVRLGLPTARVIMEDHGGAMHVESAPGKGTTFHLEPPRNQPRRG